MKYLKSLLVLISLLSLSKSYSQIDSNYSVTNELHYVYPTLQRVVDLLPYMDLHKKIEVDVSIDPRGGWFVIHDSTESTRYRQDGGTVIGSTTSSKVAVRISDAKSVRADWFGMVADGVTNNYYYYQNLAKFVNNRGGDVDVYFSRGTYYIDTMRIYPITTDSIVVYDTTGADPNDTLGIGGTHDTITSRVILDTVSNNIQDIQFTNVRNVRLIGSGTIIKCRGNFKRRTTSRTANGVFEFSNYVQVRPIYFVDSKNISVEGIEIDGDVLRMTRDPKVVEGSCYGLSFASCDNITLNKVYVHHWATDGIIFTGSNTRKTTCKGITAKNVISKYNARDGLTLGGAYGGTFENCEFGYSGDSTGVYGGHPGQTGIDIEPSITLDTYTGEIKFVNCRLEGSVGSCINAALPSVIKNIYFDGGVMDNTKHNNKYVVAMGINNFVIENMTINTGTGTIYPVWSNGKGQSSTIRNCHIFTKSNGILYAATSEFGTTIENNVIEGVFDTAYTSYFPYINATCVFRNNTVIYPASFYGHKNAALLQFSTVTNNRFVTTLDTTGNKHIGIYMTNSVSKDNFFPTNTSLFPAGGSFTSASFVGTTSLVNGSSSLDPHYIYNNPSTQQAQGRFDIYYNLGGSTGGSRIANTQGLTSPFIPGTAALGIVLRNANYFNVGLSMGVDGAASGMNLSSLFTNEGSSTVGGYPVSTSLYYSQATSITSFQQNTGRFYFRSKMGAIQDTLNAVPIIAILDTTGISFTGNNPTARLNLRANSTVNAGIQFDLAGAALRASLIRGSLEAVSNYLFYTDSTLTRDTLATRRWTRTQLYTDAQARTAISINTTNTGTIGAATLSYNNTTGTFTANIPRYDLASVSGGSNIRNIEIALGTQIQTENFAPDRITVNQVLTSGTIRYIAMWLPRDTILTGVKWLQTTQGNYTANNYNGVALYSYSAGVLTQVAVSTNDGTIWSTSVVGALGSKAFSSPYTATAGLYYVALLYSASAATTAPSIGAATVLYSAGAAILDFTNNAKLFGQASGQTALPSTVNMSAIAFNTIQFYTALY